MFGNPDLLHYDLGLVVKYAKREDSFPAVVSAAEKLAAGKEAILPPMQFTCGDSKPSSHKAGKKTVRLINFSHGVDSIKVCALAVLKTFEKCKNYWTDAGTKPDEVKVIFFGGHYERDDIYLTPIGEKPGVTIQAYTYFSWGKPLEPVSPWLAWVIEIGLGFVGGLLFHGTWLLFHYCRRKGWFALQVILALANFMYLIDILFILGHWIARLLAQGIWLHPVPMFVGLFLDSYIATATATGTGRAHGGHAATTPAPSLPHRLFGIPGPEVSGWDLTFHRVLKIGVFLITIGLAICSMLWLPH